MNTADLAQRLAEVERRLDALESTPAAETQAPAGDNAFWLLNGLAAGPDIPDGSVAFGGDVQLGGRSYQYQWQRPTHAVTDEPWTDAITRLSALAHPLRAEILRRLLAAPATAADLVEEGIVSSTSTAYHHLNELSSAGWITKAKASTFEIRASRVIPLMTIIIAGEDH